MTAIVITPRGPFSLAASMRFLEGFTPAAYRGASDGRVLRLAFPADDGPSTVSAEIGAGAGLGGRRTGECHRAHRESEWPGPWVVAYRIEDPATGGVLVYAPCLAVLAVALHSSHAAGRRPSRGLLCRNGAGITPGAAVGTTGSPTTLNRPGSPWSAREAGSSR
jgi:hypothetical protein